MADNQLTTSAGSSSPESQVNTQNPQGSAPQLNTGTQPGDLQTGTASGLLNGSAGITLRSPALPSVSLPPVTATAVAASQPLKAAAPSHHANTGLLGLAAVLLLVAIAVWWSISRSVKSTTS